MGHSSYYVLSLKCSFLLVKESIFMKNELVLGHQTNQLVLTPVKNQSLFPQGCLDTFRGGLKLWSGSSSETQPVVMSILTQCGLYNSMIFTGRSPPQFEPPTQRNPNTLKENHSRDKT